MKASRFPAGNGTAARPGRGSAVIPLRRRGGTGRGARPAAAPGEGRPAVRRIRVDVYRLAIAITLIYFVVTAINQEVVLTRLNRQLGSLESELETVRAQQAVLRERIAYLQSDSYIVQEARGRFGMAHPGEIRYVIIEDDRQSHAGDRDDPATPAARDAGGDPGAASGGEPDGAGGR